MYEKVLILQLKILGVLFNIVRPQYAGLVVSKCLSFRSEQPLRVKIQIISTMIRMTASVECLVSGFDEGIGNMMSA